MKDRDISMRKNLENDLIRESIREILVQEGFLSDLIGAVKTGVGNVYDTISGAVKADEPKSGILKALDDLSPDPFPYADQGTADDVVDSSGLVPSPIDRVNQKPGVTWSDSTLSFVRRLREELDKIDPSVPITITSAVRTEREQAHAMFKKWQAGGDSEIRNIYGSKAEEFLAAPKSPDSWEQIIRARNERGQRTSPHMRGVAIDIRTRDLGSNQIDSLMRAVEAAGGRNLLEKTPPHLHVDGFADSSGSVYT